MANGELVAHEVLPNTTPAAFRFFITTGIVSARISVGLNSTISAPAWWTGVWPGGT